MILNNGYTHIHGPEVNTRAVVSQKVRLFSFNSTEGGEDDFQQIGVMSSFSVSESRNAETVRGIGFGDRIAELVPSVTEPATITSNRIALYLSNIFQAFGYQSGIDGIVRSLRHHRWPFDIRQEMVFSQIEASPPVTGPFTANGVIEPGQNGGLGSGVDPDADSVNALLTFYEGCWMTSYGITFDSGSAVVTENCNISVTDITAGVKESSPEDYFGETSNSSRSNLFR